MIRSGFILLHWYVPSFFVQTRCPNLMQRYAALYCSLLSNSRLASNEELDYLPVPTICLTVCLLRRYTCNFVMEQIRLYGSPPMSSMSPNTMVNTNINTLPAEVMIWCASVKRTKHICKEEIMNAIFCSIQSNILGWVCVVNISRLQTRGVILSNNNIIFNIQF